MSNELDFASGGSHGLLYCKENTFGVTPTTPAMKRLRHTSCSIVMSKNTLQSNELREDAQISDMRHGNRQVSGDVGVEFSYGSFDDLLAAVVRGAWSENKLVAGVDVPSFTLQRIFKDVTQYEVFTGCKVGGLKLSMKTNAMVTGSFSFVGKEASFTTEALDADPENVSTAQPFDGFSGQLREGGVAVSVVTGLDLSIENSLSPLFVLGSASAGGINAGRINVTGTVSAYFQNMELLKKFVNEEESSLEFVFGDGVNQSYKITLPRIKYSGGTNSVDGEGVIALSMPFQALYDECTSTNITIERIPGTANAACALTYATDTFTESATTPGTFDGSVNVTLSGGNNKTFLGVTGGAVPGVTFTGLPEGLTASVTKTGATTASISLSGTATDHLAASSTTINVVFSAASFAFGFCRCPGATMTGATKALTITFTD